jgi:hypothetical protein
LLFIKRGSPWGNGYNDTEDVLVAATGTVNFARERLNMQLRSESKSFTVGTLPTAILIATSFCDPSIGLELAELLARGGAAAELAVPPTRPGVSRSEAYPSLPERLIRAPLAQPVAEPRIPYPHRTYGVCMALIGRA